MFPERISLHLPRLSYLDSKRTFYLMELAEMKQRPYGKHLGYVCVCICRSFFFYVIICELVHGENVECDRLPVLSTAGLVMLCRLFFFFFLILLQSPDQNRLLKHVQARQKKYLPTPKEFLCCVLYRAILH